MRLRLHLLRLPSFTFSLQLNQSVKLTLTSSSAPQSDTPSQPQPIEWLHANIPRSAYFHTSSRGVENQAGWEVPTAGGAEGGNEEEAERAKTRGTGFTSPFPPPGSTSRRTGCRLVIGWINEGRGGFILHKEWAGIQSARGNSRTSVPPLFSGGVGGSGVGLCQPRPAFAKGLKKQTVF